MALVTARSSTIFIATGEDMKVFRSIEEVPPTLRRQLVNITRGLNSATILIADKRGREELARALQGHPSDVQSRLVDAIRSRQSEKKVRSSRRRFSWRSLRTWIELLLPAAVGASLWLIIDSHF